MSTPLAEVLAALEAIAPLALAEDWDNVGLLIEPPGRVDVARVVLTIDLTEAVLDEALGQGCDLIVAYHPPIFAPLARLTQATATERIAQRAVAAGVAVYSPHTALDAAAGGVNDWLADGLGEGSRASLQEPAQGDAPGVAGGVVGQGRAVDLRDAVGLAELVTRIKAHLGLAHVRVAVPDPAPATVRRVLLCAGAGGSVLAGRAADVYWTGEMRHHDVLAALAQGTAVVLCEHTNTERGYLAVLRQRLLAALGGLEIVSATADREPLRPADP